MKGVEYLRLYFKHVDVGLLGSAFGDSTIILCRFIDEEIHSII